LKTESCYSIEKSDVNWGITVPLFQFCRWAFIIKERSIDPKSIKKEISSDKEKKTLVATCLLAVLEKKIGNPIKINCKKRKFELRTKEKIYFWAKSEKLEIVQANYLKCF
jgi:hypothetical protein